MNTTKTPLLSLLIVAVIVLGIAGCVFLAYASGLLKALDMVRETPQGTVTPALVAGITCLTLSTGLLVLGLFMFRKRD